MQLECGICFFNPFIKSFKNMSCLVNGIRKKWKISSLCAAGAVYCFFFVQWEVPITKKGDHGEKPERFPNSQSGAHDIYSQDVDDIVNRLLQKGKTWYERENFEKANPVFENLVTHYSYKVEVDEAFFLLAKGYFQVKDYIRSEETVNRLLNLGRGSKWEGYALLVLAEIQKERGEDSKSLKTYNAILDNYSDPALQEETENILLNL